MPIFVLTQREPDGDTPRWPQVTYVTDVANAMARAKDAASDRNVLVHGARTAQLALAAGVLDELEIQQISVLLGQGRRLFDHLGPDHIELELDRIVDAPESPTSATAPGAEREKTTGIQDRAGASRKGNSVRHPSRLCRLFVATLHGCPVRLVR